MHCSVCRALLMTVSAIPPLMQVVRPLHIPALGSACRSSSTSSRTRHRPTSWSSPTSRTTWRGGVTTARQWLAWTSRCGAAHLRASRPVAAAVLALTSIRQIEHVGSFSYKLQVLWCMPTGWLLVRNEEGLSAPGMQVYGATHLNKSAPFDLAWVHRKLVADAYRAGVAAWSLRGGEASDKAGFARSHPIQVIPSTQDVESAPCPGASQ